MALYLPLRLTFNNVTLIKLNIDYQCSIYIRQTILILLLGGAGELLSNNNNNKAGAFDVTSY